MSAIKPMLAKTAKLELITYPIIVQPKLDGVRALVVNGRLQTRSGKSFENSTLNSINLASFEGADGELILYKNGTKDFMGVEHGMLSFNETSRICRKRDAVIANFSYHIMIHCV